MSDERRTRMGSLVAELAIVFIGVFVALAADSWWDNREAHARLESSLEALARDLSDARADLVSAIAQDSATADKTSRMAEALRVRGPVAPETAASDSIASIRIPPIPFGTLRFLVESGDVRLIDDASARGALIEGLARLESGVQFSLGLEDPAAIELPHPTHL